MRERSSHSMSFNRVVFAAVMAILLLATTAAYAGPSAYLFTGQDYWGTIDLTTGVFNVLGNTGTLLIGTGEYGGNVYGGDVYGNTLYQINKSNGSLTTIGTGSIAYNEFGSTSGGLFGLGTNADLYSINPSTGAATLIGPTGLTIAGTIGMSAGPGGLYYTEGNNLFVVNTTTGAGTLIGPTGVSGIGAMVWIGGVLYAGTAVGPYDVYTMNTTTGAATFVTGTSGSQSADFWGLAPISSTTPEPSTLLQLGTGLAGMAGLWFRRRRS